MVGECLLFICLPTTHGTAIIALNLLIVNKLLTN